MASLKKYRVDKFTVDAIHKEGHIHRTESLKLRVFYPTQGVGHKLGFVIRKKTGKAVLRNRLRRTLREAFYQREGGLPKKTWMMVDLPPQKFTGSISNLRRQFQLLLDKV